MLLHLDIFVYHSAYKKNKNTRSYFVYQLLILQVNKQIDTCWINYRDILLQVLLNYFCQKRR